jgi:carbamoyl-phosphate synthase large subunit
MQSQLQSALNSLNDYTDDNIYFNLLTGTIAESKDTFRESFTLKTGLPFNPENFRNHRIQLLEKADAMIIFRTGLSESTVFEIAYNIMKGKKIPIFFVIHPDHIIKTTLIRDLNEYLGCKVYYKMVDYLDNILNDPDFIHFIKKL